MTDSLSIALVLVAYGIAVFLLCAGIALASRGSEPRPSREPDDEPRASTRWVFTDLDRKPKEDR